MRIRALSYPATLPLLLAAAYTWFAIGPGLRLQSFAMLSMTVVGATELVLAAVGTMRRQPRLEILGRVLVGAGGLVCGYALVDEYQPFALAAGSLLFAAGIVLKMRTF
jgi:hypothetical protein